MAKMPRGKDAVVAVEKIRDYVLNPNHPLGKHKARVFKAALGLTSQDIDVLTSFLRDAARDSEATLGESDEFGQRYVIDFELTTIYGAATIRSAWIVHGESEPRFVTCFVKE